MLGHRRHVWFWRFLHFLAPFFRQRLHYHYEKETLDGPTIVLANHTTNYDPILVGLAFGQQMYFVASEHTFRVPIASWLLRFVFAPIARVKGKTDARTGLEVVRTVRRGYNVCLFAEGNRTFTGVTGSILPSTGKLVKAAGGNIITYKIVGGYFTSPRWGKGVRKGTMRGLVVARYSAAELQRMSTEEVNALINRDLYEDAYARQQETPVSYNGKHIAEYLELALYMCPKCHQIGSLHTKDNEIRCACGLCGCYTPYGFLGSTDFPFTTITQWDTWQRKNLRKRLRAKNSGTLFRDENQRLYAVQPCRSSTLLAEGCLELDSATLQCGAQTFALDNIFDIAIVNRMTLAFSTTDGAHYEIKSKTMRNAVKYQHAFQFIKQAEEGI